MIESKRFKDKLSGKVRFPEDLTSKRTLTAGVLRSPISHGIIKEIEIPDHSDELFIIKAEDIPGTNKITVPGGSMPLLARNEVTYIGEPILLAACADPEELKAFLQEVKVYYEDLEDWDVPEENVEFVASRMVVKGDPEEAISQGWRIFDSRFYTPMQAGVTTPYTSAYVRSEGQKFTINSSTQWPTNVIQNCSQVTGIQRKNFTVKLNPTGKSLDSKLWLPTVAAAQAALLAQKSKKPIRLVYTAAEDFLISPKRAPVSFKYKAAVDESGRLSALLISFIMDAGSYPMLTEEVLDRICMGAAGIYQCRNIRVTGQCYRSNKPPLGAFSGLGLSQAFFAIESLIDSITLELIDSQKEEINLLVKQAIEEGDENKLKSARTRITTDPALWRSRNFLIKGNTYLSGGKLKKNPPADELLTQLLNQSDFTRKYAAFSNALRIRKGMNSPFKRKGIGLATAYMGSNFLRRERGLFASTVICRLNKEGKLTIIVTTIPENYILLKLWKQYASEILAIEEEDIEILGDEENLIPLAGPSILSRNITVTTRLLLQCCEQIKKRRFRDPLPLEVKKTFKNSPSRKWETDIFAGHPFQELSWGACSVEVEIDEVSFTPLVKKVWLVIDCGQILNRESALAEVESEVMQALGWCLVEDLPVHKRLDNYQIPGIDYLPEIHVHFDESFSKTSNALGGLVLNCLPPALRNAVSQAVQYQIKALPIRPDEIYHAMEET